MQNTKPKNLDLDKNTKAFLELDQKMAERLQNRGGEINTIDYNITAIAEYSTTLANALFDLEENTKFGVYMGQDPLDVNIINNETLQYLYESPAKEVERQIIEFEEEYSRHKSLFIFGIGNGVFLKGILANPSHTRIVVFEPEIEILYITLSLLNFYHELKNERLIILHPQMTSFTQCRIMAKMPDVLVSSRLYQLHIINKYYESEQYADDFISINKKMTDGIRQAVLEIGNDSRDYLIGISNTTKHIPALYENYCITKTLKSRAKKVSTAIVVSTGPSLHKQLNTLKKIANKVAIIAVDASYPVLKNAGIKPDFVTSIERVEPTSKFFADKPSKFDKGILFCAASLTHDATVANLQGRDFALYYRPLDYEMGFRDYDFGYYGAGQSAAHSAYNIAQALEVKNIVFIGQDLAFGEDGSSHSKGHIFEGQEKLVFVEKIQETAPAYGKDGEIVKTNTIWNLFRLFFETIIDSVNAKGRITTYNCTEGGARIAGTIERPFSEIAKMVQDEPDKDFAPPIKLTPRQQLIALNKARRRVKTAITYGQKTQKQFGRLFLKIAKAVEKAKKQIEKGKKDRVDYDNLQRLSFEIDELKSVLNNEKFMRNYYGCASSMIMHQEMEFAKIAARRSDSQEEKDDKLLEWVGAQSYWLFSVSGIMQTVIDELKTVTADWLEKK